jgi:cytochrome b561
MASEMTAGYSPAQRGLHWATAVVVFLLLPVGVLMTNLGQGGFTNALYEMHTSVGLLALVIVLFRLGVRLLRGAPPPEPSLTPWERTVSEIVHKALYGLVLVMPLLGYAGTAMCCAPVKLFWLVPVPIPLSGSEATVKLIFTLHEVGGWILAGLVAMHVAGAARPALGHGRGSLPAAACRRADDQTG